MLVRSLSRGGIVLSVPFCSSVPVGLAQEDEWLSGLAVEEIGRPVEEISGVVERFSRPLGSFAVEEISRLGEGCGLAVEEFSGWPPIGGD
jgi:hypothetical protein